MTKTDNNRLNRRWDLVVFGIIVNACLGTVYSWSVFREPIEGALGLSPAQSGIPYSVFLAAFAFSMPLGGVMMGRLGPRFTLFIGGVLVGFGWIGAGLAEHLLLVPVTFGLLGGVGVGLSYGVPLAVVGSWFPARRGLAMGLTLTGFGVSPFVTAPLASFLISELGVRAAMIVLGVAFVPVISLFSLFLVMHAGDSPGDLGAAPGSHLTLRRMLGTGRFYAFWVCYVIGTLSGLTAIGMTASFGREVVALSAPTAAGAVAAFGILNGVGRPLFGSLHDRLGTRLTVVLSFLLIASGASLALLSRTGVALPFYLGFGILWLMLGGWLSIAPAATTRLFGSTHYARNYGVMYTAYGVGAIAGGSASSVLYGRFGSHRPLFLLIILLAAVGIAIAAFQLPAARSRTSESSM
jgi:MFS transporter, OFA family, oxalate/formate antiporter